jgi:hypothetical protein
MTSKFRRINILRLTIQAGDVMVCLERVAILNCSMENNHEIPWLDPDQHSANADEEMSYRPQFRKVSGCEQGTSMREGGAGCDLVRFGNRRNVMLQFEVHITASRTDTLRTYVEADTREEAKPVPDANDPTKAVGLDLVNNVWSSEDVVPELMEVTTRCHNAVQNVIAHLEFTWDCRAEGD